MNASRPLYDIFKKYGWEHIKMYNRKRKFPYVMINKVLLMTIFEDTIVRRIKNRKKVKDRLKPTIPEEEIKRFCKEEIERCDKILRYREKNKRG